MPATALLLAIIVADAAIIRYCYHDAARCRLPILLR